ncbi:MAG TPA: selenide, water dikinase SelD [Lentimicrobium sp.]|nr:selenide, water dikinase SelD [Lentimicrobium sp.]
MNYPIYLDYNATTPIEKEVADEMLPYLTEIFGNPSSSHAFGLRAKNAVENAREQVAAMLNCKPYEIVFTGGGTESNNIAIAGIANALKTKGKHIIISAIEHPAVSEVASYLSKNGFDISIAGVDEQGFVDPLTIQRLIRNDTILVSVMHANNEIGTIQPITEIAAIAHKHNVIIHTDAAQSVGKIPVDVQNLGVDLLSIAGHKLYAPKGVGALYIRSGVRLEKYMHGANHEHDIRPGTENVSHIVALGKACSLVRENLVKYAASMSQSRNMIATGLSENIPEIRINGDLNRSLPNTLNISFLNLGAGEVVSRLSEVAVSTGAACHSSGGGSGTLDAMNLPVEYAQGAMRISTGRFTTPDDAARAVDFITKAYHKAKGSFEEVAASISNNIQDFKITEYALGMGCGCKMRPNDLESVLKDMSPQILSHDVIVGTETRDDAAVYRMNGEECIVETVDFFTPMVDNPYSFGAIAAANAVSDIYAMGATPLFALNMVAFPVDKLPLSVLKEIMQGAGDKLAEAGIPVLGGHSIEDTGIKFGMVVTGKVKTENLITNAGAKTGDMLVLTKPIGSGIITKAFRIGMADKKEIDNAALIMEMLNMKAAEVMSKYPVNACTDITGFGLAGHLHEMLAASNVDAELWFESVPFMDSAERLARMGAVPGSTIANEEFAGQWTDFTTLQPAHRSMMCDAQTSGGLLISIEPASVIPLLQEMKEKGVDARIIGEIHDSGSGKIRITYRKRVH